MRYFKPKVRAERVQPVACYRPAGAGRWIVIGVPIARWSFRRVRRDTWDPAELQARPAIPVIPDSPGYDLEAGPACSPGARAAIVARSAAEHLARRIRSIDRMSGREARRAVEIVNEWAGRLPAAARGPFYAMVAEYGRSAEIRAGLRAALQG